MTKQKGLKKLVRARAKEQGLTYSEARARLVKKGATGGGGGKGGGGGGDDGEELMLWEQYARDAVKKALAEAEWNIEDREVELDGETFTKFDKLKQHLSEMYDYEWYAYVPFDSGEAVFDSDSWDAVDEMLEPYHDKIEALGWEW